MQTTRARGSRLFGAAVVLAVSSLISVGCKSSPKARASDPPVFQREMRAAWVTTWENVDWPSQAGLSTARQQQEMDAIIERAKELKLNALFLQVRGAANAIFPSEHEPWAGSLTGTRGKAPDPFYDPLQMWIDKAHANGLELHAWMVPFTAYNDPPDTYKGKCKPKIIMHGRHAYFDPGDKDTQCYLREVFCDVVRTYNIEAIVFEHHTYPPPTTQPTTQAAAIGARAMAPPPVRRVPYQSYFFDDQASYQTYQNAGGKLKVADWRRENVNHFIVDLRDCIQREKPWMRLGISPFGIPSPDTPDFVKGENYFDQYERTYADPELWLRNGWCDYMVPELYWKTGAPHQPFFGLLQWWADPKNNPKGRNIYAGLNTSQVSAPAGSWSPDEIAGQIMISRQTPGASGGVHFSMRPLTQNSQGVADLLEKGVYHDGALPPASPWLGKNSPAPPVRVNVSRMSAADVQAAMPPRVIVPPLATTRPSTRPFAMLARPSKAAAEKEKALGGVKVSWEAPASESVWRWAVYSRHGDVWKLQVVGRGDSKANEPIVAIIRDDLRNGPADAIAVSAVDRLGNESAKTKLALEK